MFTEQQNLAIARTELDSVFYQEFEYDAAEPGIATIKTAEIFKPLTTEHAQYIEEVFKGSPLFPVIGEVQNVPLSTPRVANKLTVSIKDFAQGIEISKDLFDDNLHNVWSRTVTDFALKARISQDQNGFAFWNGAFTTSLTADGSAICSLHTLINGQTYSNTLGAGAPLTEPNLNTAILNLRTQPDQANVILGNVPAYLLVPPALFKTAIAITDSALIPGKGDNDINVYRSAYGITVYSSPFLSAAAGGSDVQWFLLARNHAVTRVVRQGIETSLRSWEFSNNRMYFYQANFREAVFASDYIGIVGGGV